MKKQKRETKNKRKEEFTFWFLLSGSSRLIRNVDINNKKQKNKIKKGKCEIESEKTKNVRTEGFSRNLDMASARHPSCRRSFL
jgi:hypothetical protein